jgi:phage gpG-like protein
VARARTGTAPLVEFFWAEDDPDLVAQQLIQLSYALDDFKAPLAAAAGLARADIKRRFETGTDPSGRAWEPWSEEYEPWALSHTKGPILPDRANLHLTGEMKGALLEESNWRFTNQDLFLDTSDVPDRWAWHNFGATRQSAEAASFAEFSGEAALFGQNELPARPFIGMSPVTRAKVTKAFDMWFRGTVEVYTTTRGRTFFRGRDPRTGRFTKIT